MRQNGLVDLSALCLLHCKLRLKACKVAIDRSDGEYAALQLVFQQAIPVRDVAFDGYLVPPLGMTDIIDRHIVVLAPEERYRVEDLSLSQHIARSGLALAFRHHPMLDPDVLLGMWIGPARYITHGVDSGDAGFEEPVHRNAAVDFEARLFCQADARPYADADDHEFGLQHAAALERRALAVDRDDGIAQMKDDAVFLVQSANEVAHVGSEHTFPRSLFRRHPMDLDITRAQRRRRLKPDKAGTDHNRTACTICGFNDRPAIRKRAQDMNVRLVSARDRQPNRLGTRRQQQAVIGNGAATGDDDFARLDIDRSDIAFKLEVDAGLGVKTVRTQRQPVLRRAAGKIILRQIRPIHRRRGIVAEHHDAAAKLLPPQHLSRGKARRTTADDHDVAGCIDRSLAARLRLFTLLPDQDPVALALHLPDRERTQRRRARRFPAAQIEARMMPRAADAVADHEPFRKRPVIMAAMRVDGENLRPGTYQQNILIADVTEQGLAAELI